MSGDGTRRDLFSDLYEAVVDFAQEVQRATEPLEARPREPEPDDRPRLRPPGALDEAVFEKLCTACGDCAKACSHDAIELVGAGNPDAGTPLVDPSKNPCHLCEDFPCAAACSHGALITPTAGGWSFGTVRLEADRCFTFRGPECGACGGLCPGERAAISFNANKPSVDDDQCVGCGRCVEACPTMPEALVFVPDA